MNQEEADQDVPDEMSEEFDSKGEVMRSTKNDCQWYWQFWNHDKDGYSEVDECENSKI